MKIKTTLTLLALLALSGVAQAADQALVIGVNKYPTLRPGSDLNGCVPDAKLMETELKAYGFEVTVLTDEAATRAGIMAALQEMADKLSSGDKAVVYFAGHGTTEGESSATILPYDARDGDPSNDIKTVELYDKVEALPAASRTVILDSCHSGGMVPMSARAKGGKNFKARYYVRTKKRDAAANTPRGGKSTFPRGTKAWQVTRVNGADNLDKTTGGDAKGEVVYFTAALQSQVANETQLDGEPHGIFTYNLSKKLDGKADLWKDVQSAVAMGVQEATDGQQTPVLAPSKFADQPLFQNGGQAAAKAEDPEPAPDPQPQTGSTLADLYASSIPDTDLLKLEFEPAISPIKIGEKIRMKVTVGEQGGYLVVVNRDPAGKFQMMFPAESAGTDGAKVDAGATIRMPSGDNEAYVADTEGTDSVKAFLFSTPEAAKKLIVALSGTRGRGLTLKEALSKRGTKSWNLVRMDDVAPSSTAAVKELVTSEIITQIAKDKQ